MHSSWPPHHVFPQCKLNVNIIIDKYATMVYIAQTMVAPTIQSILLIGYAAFEKAYRLPEFIREAAHRLMVCRTAVLGDTRSLVRTVIFTAYGTTHANTESARSALISR
jgi:hypothetical protein